MLVGDCFFELKGLEVDIGQVPVASSVDDGYEWRGPVKRHSVPVTTGPGQPPGGLEITQFFGGLWDEAASVSVLRVEYRLLVPNNRVFLVHYLLIDSTGAAVIPPDLSQVSPQGTVSPATVFQPLNPQPLPPQLQHQPIIKPVAPPKPVPSHMAQPARPKITGKTTQPVAHDDSAGNLVLDDESIAKIDVAHARSKFVRGLMSRIFEKRDSIDTPSMDEEVVSLMEQQVQILSREKQLLEDAAKKLVVANEERRQELNKLFHSVLDSEDLDALLDAWNQKAGYPAEHVESEMVL